MASEREDVPPWKRELISRRKNRAPSGDNKRHFHPSVANMRLIEPDAGNKRTMVQEKKHRASSRPNPGHRKKENDEEYGSDSSEELQYGPGIVSKLKTKYLSMTLRENQKRNVRPSLSSLRRAASLENMLDEDTTETNIQKNTEGQKTARVTKYSGGSESMKRARSMDTLIRNEPEPKPPSIINEDIVIVESPVREKCKNGLTEGELPPPDLVKQTLKIFEPSSKKGPVVRPKPKISPKPSILPKPVLPSPEKRAPRPKLPPKRPVVVPVVTPIKSPLADKPPVPKRIFAPPEEETVKYISQSALDNIGKEGMTVKYSFEDVLPEKSHLPRGSELVAQATNTALLQSSPPPPPPKPPLEQQFTSPTQIKQIAVIRPVVTANKIQNHIGLTDQEIEKNHINRVKSIEPPLSPVTKVIRNDSNEYANERKTLSGVLVANLENSSPKSQNLWDKKPWQSQNSIVFNFSDRKSIPDYIGPKGHLNGNNEDDPDGCEDDFSGPPSPCNIRFIGDNILINGKSNLRKEPRQQKVTLRIQFNDEATTLFEYPADDYSCSEDSPTSPIPSSIPLGGGSLSNYTPYKSGNCENFELGVTRVVSSANSTSNSCSSSGVNHSLEEPLKEQIPQHYLKPVDADDITPWSQETAADLLF